MIKNLELFKSTKICKHLKKISLLLVMSAQQFNLPTTLTFKQDKLYKMLCLCKVLMCLPFQCHGAPSLILKLPMLDSTSMNSKMQKLITQPTGENMLDLTEQFVTVKKDSLKSMLKKELTRSLEQHSLEVPPET